jgi:pilus assembly protein CpaE
MLDSLSLKNTKLGLETLELMGYSPNGISLVLNRADTRVGITHDDVEVIIGRTPEVFIPSDRQIPISVNDGTPIVLQDERSEAARAFQKLAERYSERELEEAPSESATSQSGKRRLAWRS